MSVVEASAAADVDDALARTKIAEQERVAGTGEGLDVRGGEKV